MDADCCIIMLFTIEIIRKADSEDLAPHVRDGYMMMFIYMPGVFETEFVPYIGQIINPILKVCALNILLKSTIIYF